MPATQEYGEVELGKIRVARQERQRREAKPDEGLVQSVRLYGVLNPLIVSKIDYRLIAGERRLEAARQAGLSTVPVRWFETLSIVESRIIELEENLKRADLPWRDSAQAIVELHKLYISQDKTWTRERTAEALSVSPGHISNCLAVISQLSSPALAEAPTFSAALNVLARKQERLVGDVLSDIMESSTALVTKAVPGGNGLEQQETSVENSVLLADFLQWAPQYSGPKFNFIHCDFPYGIEVFSGPQSGYRTYDTYQDSPDVYWALIKCLGENLDRVMAHSAHLMFWFSMDHYQATFEAFRRYAPSLALQVFPLYWIKTDNVGILPDPKRGPRRVVETALIASREDRFIVKSVANAYGCPTDKTYHTSTKPEPMLHHFFSMFVDQHSRVLDPTCGSGSALRAAERHGAAHVLGLEINPEHCAAARSALKKFRIMQKVSK